MWPRFVSTPDTRPAFVVTCEILHRSINCTPGQLPASVSTQGRYAILMCAQKLTEVSSIYCTHTHTHTHPFNGPLSGTTRVSRYQKGKINLGFTEARDSEWQWHQLGHMQVCTALQTDSHASTPPLNLLHENKKIKI